MGIIIAQGSSKRELTMGTSVQILISGLSVWFTVLSAMYTFG